MAEGARGFGSYLALLLDRGARLCRILADPASPRAIDALGAEPGVTLPAPLRACFELVDGYDFARSKAEGLYLPTFAWSCALLDIRTARQHYQIVLEHESFGGEWADYWPPGFVPLMWDGSGDYMVVNCRAGSPTYGAVYDMTKGVGCNRVSSTLDAFFNGCAEEIRRGLTRVDDAGLLVPEPPPPPWKSVSPAWEQRRIAIHRIYGDTPYFTRGDELRCIVDWR